MERYEANWFRLLRTLGWSNCPHEKSLPVDGYHRGKAARSPHHQILQWGSRHGFGQCSTVPGPAQYLQNGRSHYSSKVGIYKIYYNETPCMIEYVTWRKKHVLQSELTINTRIVPDTKVHGAHMRSTGPRWAPCWTHEPCYLGWYPREMWSGCSG